VVGFPVVIYVNPIYNINQFVLQEHGILLGRVSDCEELVGGRLWRLAEWWFHLKKHIGINSFNYVLF
jgi:hypothetical protein